MAHDTKEANRARQKRHRDKKRAVTFALYGRQAQEQLSAANDCIKCAALSRQASELHPHGKPTPCPEHEQLVNDVLAKLHLGENRASYLARRKPRSLNDDGMGAFSNHGRAKGLPRYTGPQTQVTVFDEIEHQRAMASTRRLHEVARTFALAVRKAHPNASADALWEFALEKAFEQIHGITVEQHLAEKGRK